MSVLGQLAANGRSRCNALLRWVGTRPSRFYPVVFVVVSAALTLVFAMRGTLGSLPDSPDAFDYDNIGFNLAQGRGFLFDWDDPTWLRLYDEDPANRLHDHLASHGGSWRRGSWPTASRPPMLPLIIAGHHLVFGRQFVSVRIGNVLFIAAALTLAAALAIRLMGPAAALLVPLLVVPDRHLVEYSGTILTESLALFAVVLLTWLLARLLERPSAGRALTAGAALGFGFLCRTSFVLWYPLLTVAVFLLVRKGSTSESPRQALAKAALFLCAAIAVPSPWCARNCILLQAVMPLGTQGGIVLPGGYSDAAWQSERGRWVAPFSLGLFDPLVDSESYRGLPGQMKERERSRFGAQQASEWIKRNPLKLPVLVWRRLRDHMEPHNTFEAALMLLAAGGFIYAWRHPLARLLAALVAINALAIMATYSAGGRFMIPMRGSLYVLAAVGMVAAGRWMARTGTPRTSRGPVPVGPSADRT